MSLTTKQFLANLSAGASCKASASRKEGNQTRNVTLRVMPDDITDEAFLESVMRHGIDASLKEKTDDGRTKSISGKEIVGPAAVANTCDVLGVEVPKTTPPKPRTKNKEEAPALVTA